MFIFLDPHSLCHTDIETAVVLTNHNMGTETSDSLLIKHGLKWYFQYNTSIIEVPKSQKIPKSWSSDSIYLQVVSFPSLIVQQGFKKLVIKHSDNMRMGWVCFFDVHIKVSRFLTYQVIFFLLKYILVFLCFVYFIINSSCTVWIRVSQTKKTNHNAAM